MSTHLLVAGLVAIAATSHLCSAAPSASTTTTTQPAPVFSTTCNGNPYVYNELAGYGFVAGNAVDKYGDTISIGSSLTIRDWSYNKKSGVFGGTLYGLPDRGWNTNGTNNFVSRVHKFDISLTVTSGGSAEQPLRPNLKLTYRDTVLFKDPGGAYTSGLDPDQSSEGGLKFPGFPILPTATYVGDGFGGDGEGGRAVCVDAEGLVVDDDGSFWVSDEYGPYVYKFDRNGTMTLAIAPPDAILPLREGVVSFSADSPPMYSPDAHPSPSNPTQGRQNNQGFEGLTISSDGKKLYTLLQSAARQEGGSNAATRRYTRLLQYGLDSPTPVYEAEYVVPLPTFTNAAGQVRVAAQSELHYAGGSQFFFLPRDSSVGQTFADTRSVYRHVDVFDIAGATDVAGSAHDAFNTSIASAAGVLEGDITPATVCPFLDVNVNSQLVRFGLHNGGEQDGGLLNEKWEGIALVPATKTKCKGGSEGEEYFMFVASDNDFITQDGHANFGRLKYKDASGFSLDNQVLVFRVTLGKGARPLVG
ncbi:outer membrane autotransporter [Coniochaeta ligniaria NRRL 30616]|uniref:Outer membrane autotransporter n=1 Tax=Coniochaeta ligniaria NRRL 30616 TaxID=1408157 RepID=A0A1J7J298_9PEZI|nr:outer membrane autotransporter [Coniochaeta ligniaria NRRL 30616]